MNQKRKFIMAGTTSPLNPIDDPLLSPDNCVIAFIDYQEIQFDGVHSMDMKELMANTVTLATAAKDYNVPTIVSTVGVEAFDLAPTASEIMHALGNPTAIDRTTLNSWEDEDFVAAVQETGKKRLIIAGLWTEVCVAFPAIGALKDGYDVYFVVDAIGGVSKAAYEAAMQRMIQAGAKPISVLGFVCEMQRDWGRDGADRLRNAMKQYFGEHRKLGKTGVY